MAYEKDASTILWTPKDPVKQSLTNLLFVKA
jgi:hypothetical protein